ncbi:MAG: hypothetical protein JSS17_13735 [Proteobacteria bacterium]|nr:hypothetical protein [Pseudomonadota bacterium]
MLLPQPAQRRQQQMLADDLTGGDAHGACQRPGLLLDGRCHAIDLLAHALGRLQQGAAGRRGCQTPR